MSGATRLAGKIARSLIAWAERYADPTEREWIEAIRAELGVIDGGLAQLRWATAVVPLLWRMYRADILRVVLCVAAVVVANYAYPKFATAGSLELFFFAQQLYLPLVGIRAAHATHSVLAGTVIGAGVSLLGFGVLHALGYGSPNATTLLATGSPSMFLDILVFAVVGAAFGTLGAYVVLLGSRQAVIRGSPTST